MSMYEMSLAVPYFLPWLMSMVVYGIYMTTRSIPENVCLVTQVLYTAFC